MSEAALANGPAPPETVSVWDSHAWASAAPHISVILSLDKTDGGRLIDQLARLAFADRIEVVALFNESQRDALQDRLSYLATRANISLRLIGIAGDCSGARSHAAALARSEWILFLGADMAPGGPDFLVRYLCAIAAASSPCALSGGVGLSRTHRPFRRRLHRWYIQHGSGATASERAKASGAEIDSRNALVHRDVLGLAPMDDSITDERWRDIEWALRLTGAAPVIHIDNPAHCVELKSAGELLRVQRASGASLAAVLARHPEAVRRMPVYRTAKRMKSTPARELLRFAAYGIARLPGLPPALRGRALLLWRDLLHARALACLDTTSPPSVPPPPA
jgi:hypothetical protein